MSATQPRGGAGGDDIEQITPEQFDAWWGDRGRVYDATGRQLGDLVRWNTRIGEVVRFVRDADGMFQLDASLTRILKVTEHHPAPLTSVSARSRG